MKKYTALLLDLDNTLLDFNKSEFCAIKKTLEEYSLPHDDKTAALYSAINKSFWERFERGEIAKSDIFTGRFNELFRVLGTVGDAESIAKSYCSRLSEGHDTVEGAIEILEYLRKREYKLYATTNGISTTQYRRIKDSGLQPFFDKVFVSEEAGHQKPEKEYFDFVIENIEEKDRSRMLVVGDSQSSDILGGINAGIDTCWFNPQGLAGKYIPTYQISRLDELKEILT